MKAKFTVLTERAREYVSKNQGRMVHARVLELLDTEPHNGQRLTGTLDYSLTETEKDKIPFGSLDGQVVEFGVSNFRVFNGRLAVEGALPDFEPGQLKPRNGGGSIVVPKVGK